VLDRNLHANWRKREVKSSTRLTLHAFAWRRSRRLTANQKASFAHIRAYMPNAGQIVVRFATRTTGEQLPYSKPKAFVRSSSGGPGQSDSVVRRSAPRSKPWHLRRATAERLQLSFAGRSSWSKQVAKRNQPESHPRCDLTSAKHHCVVFRRCETRSHEGSISKTGIIGEEIAWLLVRHGQEKERPYA
jgi:hypothetical protein